MRTALASILIVFAFGCSKKDASDGLPPAEKWSGEGAGPMQPNAQPGGTAGKKVPPGHPGGAGLPPGHVPIAGSGSAGGPGPDPGPTQTQPRTLEALAEGRVALGPFSIAIPAGWSQKPVTSDMRAGELVVGDNASLVIYYFGESGAGSLQDNLDRWIGQFQQPDGKDSKAVAKVEQTKLAGQEATTVSLAGRFVAEAMPGGEAHDNADYALLAAIVASPQGPFYFKLVGPKKVVDANADKFRGMLAGMKLRSP
jgi:hypothetical protein